MTRILTVAVTAVAAALALALPAVAATPTYKGTVGPGFTIKMASKPTKAGKIKLVVSDKSSQHNFHLRGPGVNVKTSVGQTGTKTFTVTLKKGTYKFMCDPHASFMKGSFKVDVEPWLRRGEAARTRRVTRARPPAPRAAPSR